MEQYYTIQEVANHLKVHRKTIYKLLGDLEHKYPEEEFYFRIPVHLRFTANHIQKIIECSNSRNARIANIGKSPEVLTEISFANPQVEKTKKKLSKYSSS